ncbi:MAG TPA: RHS repeat-associated core domain-containing protein [Terriglobia bacterium]|nr:RHS repeat-associated core domain-containing protein [Terriglobia bacterium]
MACSATPGTQGLDTCPSITYDISSNRMTAIGSQIAHYDANGNLVNTGTGVGTVAYAWDAEGRMTAAGGMTYTFHGDGRRVKKSSGTLYWYGAGGSVLAETDSSGNTTNEYIFFGGRMARRDSSGNVYYYFSDQVGSSRTITNASGSLCYDADFYPFGGERTPYVNTCAQNYKFAGMERDPETGDDHTQFRQYASNLGRWLSPDPLGGDITNSSGDEPGGPQSLNRYAYVMNNPTTLTDPSGLCTPGTQNCSSIVHLPSCTNFNCSSQYYNHSEYYGYTGGPQASCYVDGVVASSCGSAFALFSNGSADICVNEDCTVRVDNTGAVWEKAVSHYEGGPPPQWTIAYQIPIFNPGDQVFNQLYTLPPVYPTGKSKARPVGFAGCVASELISNFFGDDDQTGVTLAVHMAALISKQSAGAYLPGPGWLYTGVAVVYDVAMIGKSYVACRQ